MLSIYRLHRKTCVARSGGAKTRYDRDYRRCSSPIHIEGMCGSEYVRKSAETRNWEQAQKSVLEAEARGYWETRPDGLDSAAGRQVTIEDAIGRFLSDAERGRAIAQPTLRKYRVMFKRMRAFASHKGISRVAQFDHDLLRSWRETWSLGTAQKLFHICGGMV